MSLVTLEQFKAAITIADTVDDADLQRALDAASDWIADYCGTVFEPPDFETVPAGVQQACVLLASRWFHRLNAPFGVLESAQMGTFGQIASEDPDVVMLLAPYVTAEGSGGAVGGPTWVAV